jgi:hypothetical protein
VLSLLGALTYAELAAANRRRADLRYIREGFGRLPRFVWMVPVSGDLMATVAALALRLPPPCSGAADNV